MDFKKEFKDHHKCIADVELILPSVPYYMEIFWHLKANLKQHNLNATRIYVYKTLESKAT